MPGGSIRIANADIAFSANTGEYTRGLQTMRAQNLTLQRSFVDLSRPVAQFTESIRSSLAATVAYAAGVGAIIGGTSRAANAFITFEAGLTAVQKTADLTVRETERLGVAVNALLTEQSAIRGPLPILRQDLLEILDVAGQMNIQGIPNLRAFGEAVGLLTLTTDLQGARAADALGLVIANTTAAADASLGLASAITRLGNVNRGGEAGIIALAERLAQGASRFNIAAEDLLAVAATLSQRGLEPELSGTAFQRTLSELQNAANEALQGNDAVLREIARNLDAAYGSVEDRIQRLLTTIDQGDFIGGLRLLLEAFRNAGPRGSGGLITTLFGGDTPPARISAFLGSLSLEQERLARNTRFAAEEMREQNAILREASLFADDAGARLRTVGNQLERQGTQIGGALVAAFLPVAENFRALEVLAVGVGAAFASNFSARRIRAIRQAGQELQAQRILQRDRAQDDLVTAQNSIRLEQQRADSYMRGTLTLQDRQRALQRVGDAEQRQVAARNQQLAAQARLDDINRRRLVLQTQLRSNDLGQERQFLDVTNQRLQAESDRQRQAIRNARVQFAAADQTRRAQQRIADSYVAGNVSLAQRRQALMRLQRLEQQAAGARQRLAEATSFLNRNNNLLARTTRGLQSLYGFLGGAPGVIATGLLVATTAWLNFGRTAEEQAQRVRNNVEDLQNLIRRQQEGLGLTPSGDAIRRVQEDIGTIANDLRETRQEIENFRDLEGIGDLVPSTLVNRAEDLNEQIIVMRELVVTGIRVFGSFDRQLQAAQQRIAQFFGAAERVGDGTVTAFQRLNLSLETPARRLREFQEQLRDVSEESILRSGLELRIAGFDPQAQNEQLLLFREELAIRRRQLEAERSIRDAREDVERATTLRDIARAEAQRLGTSTRLGEEAANQATQAQRNLDTAILTLREKREELFLARDLTISEERRAQIARQAAAERRSQIAEAQQQFVPAVRPDTSGVELRVEEEIAAIRRSVEEEGRAASQRIEITRQFTREQRAALEAQFETENRLNEVRASAVRDYENAQRRLVNINQLLAQIQEDQAAATGNALDALIEERNAARETRQSLIAEVAERLRAIEVIDNQAGAFEELARRRAAIAAEAARQDEAGPSLPGPDIAQAQRDADQAIAAIRRGVEERRLALAQQQQIDQTGVESRRAALQAEFEIESRFSDLRREAAARLADAQREARDTTIRFAEVQARLVTETRPALIASLRDELTTMQELQAQVNANVSERMAEVDAIDGQAAAVRRLAEEAGRLAAAGELRPFEQLARSIGDLRTELEEGAVQGIQRFGDSISQLAVEGRLNFEGLADAIIGELARILVRAVIVANILRALGFGLGAGGGAAIPGLGAGPTGFTHSGGIAGHPPRYRMMPYAGHIKKMLRPRERLTVLEEDEEVLTRRDPRHRWNIRSQSYESLRAYISRLPRYHQGGVAGGGQGPAAMGGTGNLTVRLINQTSRDVRIEDGGQRFDGEGYVQNIVLKDISRNGPITQGISLAMRRRR